MYTWASLVAQMVKNPPAMQETWVWPLGWEDPLEEGMATHSSILVWRIPIDRGAWQATVHGVTKSQTRLRDWTELNRGKHSLSSVVAQLCPTLCNSMDCCLPGSSVYGDSPGKNTGMGSHSLLQGIVPTQGLNPGLLHCRWNLYHLSHQGSPRILECIAYPFLRGSSWPRNWTRVSCIAGWFFTSWATREVQ